MPKLLSTIRNRLPLTGYVYRGEEVCCNLCGSHRRLVVSRTDRRLKTLTSVACEQCGLIRTDPMPTDEELGAYYAGEYRLDYQFAFSGRPPRFHVTRSRRDAAARLELLGSVMGRPRRILDFGAGSGEFLALAAEAGHHAEGIEPGESFAAFARATYGVTVHGLVWQQARFAAASFDVITANHVLEHLREPVSALKRMAGWLSPDGVLYASVPNGLGKRRHSFQHFHFAHVHTFTPQALIWAGMIAGLEPDPRFENHGTSIVFRKRPQGPATPAWGEGEGHRVAGRFEASSPVRFLASGRWIVDSALRLRKVARDSLARV